jgi:hypothetical protein
MLLLLFQSLLRTQHLFFHKVLVYETKKTRKRQTKSPRINSTAKILLGMYNLIHFQSSSTCVSFRKSFVTQNSNLILKRSRTCVNELLVTNCFLWSLLNKLVFGRWLPVISPFVKSHISSRPTKSGRSLRSVINLSRCWRLSSFCASSQCSASHQWKP